MKLLLGFVRSLHADK